MSNYLKDLVDDGRVDLANHATASTRPGMEQLAKDASSFAVQQFINLLPSSNFQAVNGPKKSTTTAMARVAGVLAAKFNNGHMFAFPNHDELISITGLQKKTLKTAIQGLRDAGLFGMVPSKGQGHSNTYYPLFHAGANEAFRERLDRMHALVPVEPVEDEATHDDGPPPF